MEITRITGAGVRRSVGTERKAQKKPDAASDRVLLSASAVRRMEAPPKSAAAEALDSLTPDRKTQSRCRKIAARIRAGDHVPQEDRKYLAQYDAMSYQLAMALRRVKARPKHWDSVLKDARDAHKPTAAGVTAVLAPNQGYTPGCQPQSDGDVPQGEEEEV